MGKPNPWGASPQNKTILKQGYTSLYIGWDADYDPEDIKSWHVILTSGWKSDNPFKDEQGNLHDTDYQHIRLELDEAKKLHSWLSKFITKVSNALEINKTIVDEENDFMHPALKEDDL